MLAYLDCSFSGIVVGFDKTITCVGLSLYPPLRFATAEFTDKLIFLMAFDKAKVLKAAEKFLSQGKITAAIKEYRQIVKNDDDDFTTLNMLGDLCARANQKDEAVKCFSRIAEHYYEQEFTLKAIAMYKKIERLRPRDPAIAGKLAALYAAQGLTADARAQYLIVADAYTRAGKTKETLEILHQVADLDPHNTEIRLKLAEGYLKEGLRSEAAGVFIEAAIRLFDTGVFEKALDCYSKALALSPQDEVALRGVISSHVAMGTADEAAELLEGVMSERPNDPELSALLTRTYIAAEDAKGAERATAMMVAHDPSNYKRFIEVAQLYLKKGELNETTRILGTILEQLLAGREENELLALVNETLERNPDHIEALRLLIRIHWWQRDMEKLRAVLERMAEAAQAAGLVDDERYALVQLIRLAPDEVQFSERLDQLGGVTDDAEAAAMTLDSSSYEQSPPFESFAIVKEETDLAGIAGRVQVDQFEWNSVSESAPVRLDASASFADLNEALEESKESGQEVEFGDVSIDEGSVTRIESVPTADKVQRETMMRQELESVDFYITQGYADIAADTLDLLEKQFGSDPDIDARRQALKRAAQEAQVTVSSETFEFGAEEPFGTVSEPQVGSSSSRGLSSNHSGGIDAGLAEIFEEFRAAAEEEPVTSEDFETHYNMATAYKEMDLLDEAIQEFQNAAALTSPGDGTSRYLQCCNMLGHCFLKKEVPRAAVLWFKKGLEIPANSEEEYKALRYELASAYENMGDLSRALDEFTEVYGIDVSYRGVAEKLRELQTQKLTSKVEE